MLFLKKICRLFAALTECLCLAQILLSGSRCTKRNLKLFIYKNSHSLVLMPEYDPHKHMGPSGEDRLSRTPFSDFGFGFFVVVFLIVE